MKNALLSWTLGLLVMATAPFAIASPLENGDFTPDFTGWSGETTDLANGVLAATPDTDPRFSLLGSGLAKLTTDPNDPDNIYGVDLFQAFDLPSDVTTIEFDFGWEISDPGFDLAEVILTNTADTLDSLLLAEGLTATGAITPFAIDISSFAGKNVQLLFRVEDAGDDVADSITFGNIVINQPAASVPAPTTLALFGLGVAIAGWRRRRAAS